MKTVTNRAERKPRKTVSETKAPLPDLAGIVDQNDPFWPYGHGPERGTEVYEEINGVLVTTGRDISGQVVPALHQPLFTNDIPQECAA